MKLSAIGSKNTYHKCLKELHQFGYIFYRASVNKFHKSTVHIVKLDTGDSSGELQQLDLFSPTPGAGYAAENPSATSPNPVQVKDATGIKIDTVPVPYLTFASPIFDTVPVPYLGLLIKHKHINSKQERGKNSLTQKIFSKNKKLQEGINAFSAAPKNVTPKESSSFPSPDGEGLGVRPSSLPSSFGEGLGVRSTEMPKSEGPGACLKTNMVRPSSLPSRGGEGSGVRPTITHVLSFFSQSNYPSTEAQKFFNHYNSNGWKVGGKTPMQDWQSSAHKWMLNAPNFQIIKNGQNGNRQQFPILDTGPGKDYSQPL